MHTQMKAVLRSAQPLYSIDALEETLSTQSRSLHFLLTQLVSGRAFMILRAVPDQHGYEAWHRLCAQYAPTTSTRTVGMSQALIAPNFSRNLRYYRCKSLKTTTTDLEAARRYQGEPHYKSSPGTGKNETTAMDTYYIGKRKKKGGKGKDKGKGNGKEETGGRGKGKVFKRKIKHRKKIICWTCGGRGHQFHACDTKSRKANEVTNPDQGGELIQLKQWMPGSSPYNACVSKLSLQDTNPLCQ
eukprot:6491290-Amphidinium_carterae.4